MIGSRGGLGLDRPPTTRTGFPYLEAMSYDAQGRGGAGRGGVGRWLGAVSGLVAVYVRAGGG